MHSGTVQSNREELPPGTVKKVLDVVAAMEGFHLPEGMELPVETSRPIKADHIKGLYTYLETVKR